MFFQTNLKSKNFNIFTSNFIRKECLSNDESYEYCMQIFQKYIGPAQHTFGSSLDATIFAQLVSGGSLQQLDHLVQIFRSGDFCTYDYGYEGNFEKYGKIDPNVYNLSKVSVPTIIYFGDNDFLASTWDTHNLYKEIQSTVGLQNVIDQKFNHFDFIAAKNVHVFMYSRIMVALHKFMEGQLKYMIE